MTVRLVTLDVYRARYQGSGPVVPLDDSAVLARIDALSAAILHHLGFPAGGEDWDSASRVWTFGPYDWAWNPWSDESRLVPQFSPVASVTSIEESGDGSTWTTVQADYYALRDGSDPARVRIDAIKGARWSAESWYRVTYVAGWTTVPGAVEDAAGRLVAFSLDVDRRRGRQGESGVGQPSETYRPETWPDDLRAQLAPFKLPWRR